MIERAVIATTGGVLRLPNAELQMQRNKTAKARPQCHSSILLKGLFFCDIAMMSGSQRTVVASAGAV